MKRSERWLLVPVALAAVLCAALAARVAGHARGARIELGRARLSTVTEKTRLRLLALDEPVTATWYRTPPRGMPAHLRQLEDGVRSVLEAFRAASEGRFDYRVLDPDEHPELAEFLSSAGVAPWRARRVERDGWREDRLWSSLRLAYGPRAAPVVNGLGPDHLPELQRLILAQLDELERPRRPVVALDAPQGYERMRALIAEGGVLLDARFDERAEVPEGADVLVWLAPRSLEARHLAALDRFLARGGSAIVAASALEATEEGGLLGAIELSPARFPVASFLAHYGLRPLEGLLLDAGRPGGGHVPELAHRIPCIAPAQDFRTMRGQPNGTLVFTLAAAFDLEPARLAERGLDATVLGAARESAVLAPVPDEPLPTGALASLPGEPASKAGLAAILRPADPFGGALVFLASPSPFGDELLGDERYAHEALAKVLLSSLTAPERLVASRIALAAPAPLRELSARERLRWRALVALLPPALVALGLLSLLRSRGRRQARLDIRPTLAPLAAPLAARLAALAAALGAPLLFSAAGGVDLTREGANRFTAREIDTLRTILAREGERDGEVAIETWFSAPGRLPAELRPRAREARRAAAELARRVPGLAHRAVIVGELDERARATLAQNGVGTHVSSSQVEEVTSVRRVVSAIRVARGDRARLVELRGSADYDSLRFRLAFALWRLATERDPRIAFAAEQARLSPAEAALEYQQRGLFAPREGDVYTELRALLERAGFRVQTLDPRRPEPIEAELLFWVQPRRDMRPLLERATEFLSRGGRAVIAAQHFRILARQLEREGLALRFWPEPQYADLERHYLPELGIELAREVLFDRLSAPLEISTRLERPDGASEYVAQESSQPFLIRAAEPNFAPGELAVRGLGDLLLPYANRIVFDPAELARRGIEARPWIWSSPFAWTYDWKGGDLSEEVLAGPGAGADPARSAGGPAALAVHFRGPFPAARVLADEGPAGGVELLEADPLAPPGELLLVGCSEAWRNELLKSPRFRHDRFALRAAAELALEPELAAFLRGRAAAPGLGYVEPAARLRWRAFVLSAFPLALFCFGLLRRRAP